MMVENLLVEIGTEELPPKSLRRLAQSFADNVQQGLSNAEIEFDSVQWLAAPRRLALIIKQAAAKGADKQVDKRGPAVSVAFDEQGNPSKAAQGWARSNGIEVAQAERLATDKGEWLLHRSLVSGQALSAVFPTIVSEALNKLPIPKPMRWGNKSTQFIRPVHTITMLYGDKLIQGTILGIESARTIRGHRFMGEAEFELAHADNYIQDLDQRGKVIVDYERRLAIIREQVEAEAVRENGIAQIDEDLLEEVNSLVEWPVAMVGGFEEKYLEVPSEALIYTMKDNQKYFPILAKDGGLLPRFIFISNIVSKDPIQVIEGNEKVVRPRLADAEFFYKTDRKFTLEQRLDSLNKVVFQQKLGTLLDKSKRVSELAAFVAASIGASSEHAQRAGLLCKADLMSEMVLEFPDIQGVMGMYYAQHDGEHELVAQALCQQYWPRFSGDKLPESKEASSVAIADKLDTLVGIFAAGILPKGDKDPFALKRAATGILRIAIEQNLDLDLTILFTNALNLLPIKLDQAQTETLIDQLIEFVHARLKAQYLDQGVDATMIQSVLVRKPTNPLDIERRVKGVAEFCTHESADSLAAANKRVSNILSKNAKDIANKVDQALLVEPAELALSKAIVAAEQQVAPLFEAGEYGQGMQVLSTLREPVDLFFESVMVMADDSAIKANRLALLASLQGLFLQVADISIIQ
ncbi:glycine--tRNA ligase subunit beta [Alginatibacterium sediminis]|uniref:Glycine--tRNA ligase beta subunit n=1 Tax=Alginatibacterium sediminis TaxID=2164068 RepID=A0A420ENF3_9ALTE|nr:glycine--tRNA ligase subunit beta [Alginatibacterium sediminis]RKF22265.1 glycine--tRNA ligase subunit beta [Alginatibacterium sediminis]